MSNSNSNGIDISDSKSGSISDGDKVKIGNSLTNEIKEPQILYIDDEDFNNVLNPDDGSSEK